ncbi:bilirubin utilization transcriptional regulator BilQ [uncultured Clostridium sp.]|uniref:bilirubin utilization transcriptional regulator BilQ n=1 Tax=uncultured Clostridium sp. TaxID=59620 RepID=UPI0025858C86|nr:bilirubin utilization transcriptional regulator BilQ [uncultured Clostridium sp.]
MLIDSLSFYISFLRKNFTEFCSEKLSEMGLTYGQVFIVIYIGKNEACSPKDISKALNLDAGHLNRTLSKLIENNFILQKKNENDKRANIVTLTSKGQEVFKRSYSLFDEWDDLVLSSFTENKKEELMGLIKKVAFSQKENILK